MMSARCVQWQYSTLCSTLLHHHNKPQSMCQSNVSNVSRQRCIQWQYSTSTLLRRTSAAASVANDKSSAR